MLESFGKLCLGNWDSMPRDHIANERSDLNLTASLRNYPLKIRDGSDPGVTLP
jgi:hypothetical protein